MKREIGDCTLYLADCEQIMAHTLPCSFDLCLTDPPYGINMDGGNVGYKGFNNFEKLNWDKAPPTPEVTLMVRSMAQHSIIWGGNYFHLPPSRGWLIWDKGRGFKGRTYAEAELAWTSFDANIRIFEYDPLAGGDYKGKCHPTQKPIQLMKWCIQQADKASDQGFANFTLNHVFDPFMGSGSTGVACALMGRKFTGIEKHPAYFEAACERIENAYRQGDMFGGN